MVPAPPLEADDFEESLPEWFGPALTLPLQVEDRVPEERMVLDPPLLRLETESSHAYLSVLTHMVLLRPQLRPQG